MADPEAADQNVPSLLPGGGSPHKRAAAAPVKGGQTGAKAKEFHTAPPGQMLEVLTKKATIHSEILLESKQIGCRITSKTMFRIALYHLKDNKERVKIDLMKGPKNIRGDQIYYATCDPGRVNFELCCENHGFRPVRLNATFRAVEKDEGMTYTIREIDRSVDYPPLSAWAYDSIQAPKGGLFGGTKKVPLNYVDVKERRHVKPGDTPFITQIYLHMVRAAFVIRGDHTTVQVRMPDSNLFQVTIGKDNSIMEMKTLIAEYANSTLFGYKLTHNDKKLHDSQTLSGAGLNDFDMVKMEPETEVREPQLYNWEAKFQNDTLYNVMPFVIQIRTKNQVPSREQVD